MCLEEKMNFKLITRTRDKQCFIDECSEYLVYNNLVSIKISERHTRIIPLQNISEIFVINQEVE